MGWGDEEDRVPYVPHSLRHGGATCDYLYAGGESLEDILFRGRWASMKSTRQYIQQGPALMAAASTRIPRWQRESGHHFGNAICDLIEVPDYL